MKIIISPAKKMRTDTDSMAFKDLPEFIDDTETLLKELRRLSREDLKKLWKCNDSILDLNIRRLETMDLRNRLTPALLSYEGIQYQYMAPGVFTHQEFDYVQKHLRILSGFYGVLKPFDGVTPYRLEMQAKLSLKKFRDLYAFWGPKLANSILVESDQILNLASREYSVCISQYLPEKVHFHTCVFGEEMDGKVIEKGTICKMARGEMVRWLAEHQITTPERVRAFDRLGYRFCEERSNDDTYVFLKKKEESE